MLQQFIRHEHPTHLITYTRNPSILRMMMRVSETIYPISQDDELESLAALSPHATRCSNATYHLCRYSEAGLFRGGDPADRPFVDGRVSLKNQFTLLESVRNALIVTARIRREI